MGREGFLGEFEQMLLLAAMRLEDEAYGMRLMEELEISVGRKLSRGSAYVTLERLEDKGWIVSEHSASRPERGDGLAGSFASHVRVWRRFRSHAPRS